MTTHATDGHTDAQADHIQRERYADLTIGDGEYVIYDRQNHQAWVQSSEALSLDGHR
ncbi:DUF7331 family protein [Halococcoides cellulosivorans]|uniref:DUF7331 family protein n=1 Tax=Halococcoides cellulosivorans TaxID=1679096 RepID=UPI001571B393|nr:hypothetical protein [Halococcoides cellulosivorans]